MQAAVLRLLLPELDGWNEARRRWRRPTRRRGSASTSQLPRSVDSAEHVYHLYVVRHERADELAERSRERGIAARGYYRVPVHLQPAMRSYGAGAELPGNDGGRPHEPRAADGPGAEPGNRSQRSVGRRCASGST